MQYKQPSPTEIDRGMLQMLDVVSNIADRLNRNQSYDPDIVRYCVTVALAGHTIRLRPSSDRKMLESRANRRTNAILIT